MTRATDILCVFRIQFAGSEAAPPQSRLRFLAGSIVFSLSLTSISWLGYLLLENRFTGRLKLFATMPLAPSSYILGILLFAFAQAALGTTALILIGRTFGVRMRPSILMLGSVVMLTVLCLCGLGAIIAARARSFTQGALLTDALGAGLVFFAPIYYRPEVMPPGLREVSRGVIKSAARCWRLG